MEGIVKLNEIIDGMDMLGFERVVLLHIKTGKVISIAESILRDAEEDERGEDVEEELELAYDIIDNNSHYLELPSEYEIHEYRMMEGFCYTIENEKEQNALLRAITGKGAFRRFKDTIGYLGVDRDWYDYRYERYKQIAIRFCERNILEYEE